MSQDFGVKLVRFFLFLSPRCRTPLPNFPLLRSGTRTPETDPLFLAFSLFSLSSPQLIFSQKLGRQAPGGNHVKAFPSEAETSVLPFLFLDVACPFVLIRCFPFFGPETIHVGLGVDFCGFGFLPRTSTCISPAEATIVEILWQRIVLCSRSWCVAFSLRSLYRRRTTFPSQRHPVVFASLSQSLPDFFRSAIDLFFSQLEFT